jgi:hypothetical protein
VASLGAGNASSLTIGPSDCLRLNMAVLAGWSSRLAWLSSDGHNLSNSGSHWTALSWWHDWRWDYCVRWRSRSPCLSASRDPGNRNVAVSQPSAVVGSAS